MFGKKYNATRKELRMSTERKALDIHVDLIAIPTGTQNIGGMTLQSNTWLAACKMGGLMFQGQRADTPVLAIQALFLTLANPTVRSAGDPDPVVALAMAMEGTTIQDTIAGSPTTSSIPALPGTES